MIDISVGLILVILEESYCLVWHDVDSREGPALQREAIPLFICHHVTGVETSVSFDVL